MSIPCNFWLTRSVLEIEGSEESVISLYDPNLN